MENAKVALETEKAKMDRFFWANKGLYSRNYWHAEVMYGLLNDHSNRGLVTSYPKSWEYS